MSGPTSAGKSPRDPRQGSSKGGSAKPPGPGPRPPSSSLGQFSLSATGVAPRFQTVCLSYLDRPLPAPATTLISVTASACPSRPSCPLWRLRVPHRSPLPHSQLALYPSGARATRKPGQPVQPYSPSVPTAGCRSDAPTCPQTSHHLPEAAQAPGQGGKRPQELAEPTSCTPPPGRCTRDLLEHAPPPPPGLPAPAHTPLPRLCSPAFLLCLMVRSHHQTNEKTLRVLQEPAHRTPHLKVIP